MSWGPGDRRQCVDARSRWGTIVIEGPCGSEVARLALAGHGSPDLGAVDAVARLGLAARRRGFDLRLEDLDPELAALLELAGLAVALGGVERPSPR
jgi:hypothetical protein